MASDNLTEIFGGELVARSNGATVDVGHGRASLGVLRPAKKLRLSESSFGKQVRITVDDALGHLDLSVTDLRFFNAGHTDINAQSFADARRRLARGEPVLLSVGLARAFVARNDTAGRHWLQVNNIHFAEHPGWRLDEA